MTFLEGEKACKNLGIERNFFKLIKNTHEKPTANTVL